jgi:hypothetical protein
MMGRQARASVRVMRLWKPMILSVLPAFHYPGLRRERGKLTERRSPDHRPDRLL